MLAISNPSRRNLLRLEYDAIGRLSRLTLADGTAYRFRYTSNAYGTVSKVEVLSSRGRKTKVTLNASSYAISAPE